MLFCVVRTCCCSTNQVWCYATIGTFAGWNQELAGVCLQASGNMSHMEAQVASLQQALLQAKHLMHVKLQDAVAGQKQSDKTVKVTQRRFCYCLHWSIRSNKQKVVLTSVMVTAQSIMSFAHLLLSPHGLQTSMAVRLLQVCAYIQTCQRCFAKPFRAPLSVLLHSALSSSHIIPYLACQHQCIEGRYAYLWHIA